MVTEPSASLPTTPEEYRRRYVELQRAAQESAARRPAVAGDERNPAVLPAELIVREETIPGGWYWSTRLTRGQSLRIVNDDATSGVSALFWNADDTSERYNAADTMKLQWSAAIGKGSVLFSDMGRVLMSVTEGEDKPLKYPTIFKSADVAVITKNELATAVEFDWETARRSIESVRPGMQIFRLSAKTGEGMGSYLDFLSRQLVEQGAESNV